MATSLHHSSRGQKKARAGEGGGRVELHGRGLEDSCSQPVLFQLYEEEPGGRRPASLAEPPGPQEAGTATHMEQLADVAPVPSLAVPEPQMVDQVVDMIKHVDSVVPGEVVAVPKISWPSRFLRTVLREPQKTEQLVEVPVPVPSFSGMCLWEETFRRTGHTWLGGFEWRLTASPGRFQILGQDLVDAPGIEQLLFQFVDRVVEIRGCGCHLSYAQCKLCSSGECGVNCSDKFQ